MAGTNLSPYQFNGGNEYTAPNGRTYTMRGSGAMVTAHTPSGRKAGAMVHSGPLSSEPEQQTIGDIRVSGPHQGKGVAAAMLDYARQSYPDLHHSQVLTKDGKGFAASTPRHWQPKLPLSPETNGGPNGGESGPSPWSTYVDFGPKNRRSRMKYDAQLAESRRLRASPPSTDEQGRLW